MATISGGTPVVVDPSKLGRLPETKPQTPSQGSLDHRTVDKGNPQVKLAKDRIPPPSGQALDDRCVSLSDRSDSSRTGGSSATSDSDPVGSHDQFRSEVRQRLLTGKELIAKMGSKPAWNRRRFLFFGKITWQSNYKQTVNELKAYQAKVQTLKVERDPGKRQAQLRELEADLANIKTKANNYLAGNHTEKQKGEMRALVAMADQEGSLLRDVAGNAKFNTGTHDLSWSAALEFRRAGVPLGDHTKIGQLHDGNVKSARMLGAGAFNTVFKVAYKGVDEPRVIKQLQAEELGSRGTVAIETGIPRENPRYGARNIATALVAEKFGIGDVVPKAQYAMHNDRLALAMEFAPGVTGEDALIRYGPDALLNNPKVQQKLNDLEWLDALVGQGDRHDGNYHIDIAKDGTVKITGVDNDQSCGKNFKDPDALITRSSGKRAGEVTGHNVGMPAIISRSLANQILGKDFDRDVAPGLGDLLTRDEVSAMKDRFTAVQNKVRQLNSSGHVIDDFKTWRKPGDPTKGVVDFLREQPERTGRPHRDGSPSTTPSSYLIRDFGQITLQQRRLQAAGL